MKANEINFYRNRYRIIKNIFMAYIAKQPETKPNDL